MIMISNVPTIFASSFHSQKAFQVRIKDDAEKKVEISKWNIVIGLGHLIPKWLIGKSVKLSNGLTFKVFPTPIGT